jgi:hypothetical protein
MWKFVLFNYFIVFKKVLLLMSFIKKSRLNELIFLLKLILKKIKYFFYKKLIGFTWSINRRCRFLNFNKKSTLKIFKKYFTNIALRKTGIIVNARPVKIFKKMPVKKDKVSLLKPYKIFECWNYFSPTRFILNIKKRIFLNKKFFLKNTYKFITLLKKSSLNLNYFIQNKSLEQKFFSVLFLLNYFVLLKKKKHGQKKMYFQKKFLRLRRSKMKVRAVLRLHLNKITFVFPAGGNVRIHWMHVFNSFWKKLKKLKGFWGIKFFNNLKIKKYKFSSKKFKFFVFIKTFLKNLIWFKKIFFYKYECFKKILIKKFYNSYFNKFLFKKNKVFFYYFYRNFVLNFKLKFLGLFSKLFFKVKKKGYIKFGLVFAIFFKKIVLNFLIKDYLDFDVRHNFGLDLYKFFNKSSVQNKVKKQKNWIWNFNKVKNPLFWLNFILKNKNWRLFFLGSNYLEIGSLHLKINKKKIINKKKFIIFRMLYFSKKFKHLLFKKFLIVKFFNKMLFMFLKKKNFYYTYVNFLYVKKCFLKKKLFKSFYLFFFENFFIFFCQKFRNLYFFRNKLISWLRRLRFNFWLEQEFEKILKFNCDLILISAAKAVLKFFKKGSLKMLALVKSLKNNKGTLGWRQQVVFNDVLWALFTACLYHCSSILARIIGEQIVKRKKHGVFLKRVRLMLNYIFIGVRLWRRGFQIKSVKIYVLGRVKRGKGKNVRSSRYKIVKNLDHQRQDKVHTLKIITDYCNISVRSLYGSFGIRVWINRI